MFGYFVYKRTYTHSHTRSYAHVRLLEQAFVTHKKKERHEEYKTRIKYKHTCKSEWETNTKLAHRKLKCILCAVFSASSLHLSGCFFGVLYDSNETLSINRAPHVHRIAHTSLTHWKGQETKRTNKQKKNSKTTSNKQTANGTALNPSANGTFYIYIGIKKTLHILSSSSSLLI